MSLGENIKTERKKKRIKQSELAHELAVTVRTIQNYESGNRQPNIETIKKISDFLEVPLDELLNDESTSFSSKLIAAILRMDHITIAYPYESDDGEFETINYYTDIDINSLKDCIEKNIELSIEDQLKLIDFWGKWGNEDDGIELEEFYHQNINRINKNPVISSKIKTLLYDGVTKNDTEKLVDLLEKYNFKINISNKNDESILSIYNNENPIITESESKLLPVYNEILNKIDSYTKFIIEDELKKLKK